jgi:hypothetical protein
MVISAMPETRYIYIRVMERVLFELGNQGRPLRGGDNSSNLEDECGHSISG